jgi:branched-chain amino acid transport system permease protein
MFKGLARLPFGGDVYTFPPALGGAPIQVGDAIISPQSALTIAVAVSLTIGLFLFFRFTTLGKQMRATQQNVTGAKLVGISTERVFSITWALAAGIGAAAGVLAGPISLLYPDMGTNFLLKGFAAAVLGGFESVPGAIAAGFIIGVSELLIGGYVSTHFQEVSAFVVIVLVLFLRPNGLFGRPPVQRV